MVTYPSGLKVLQCDNYNESAINNKTLEVLMDLGSISPQEMAVQAGISCTLARQRLIDCEKVGLACRDESIQGLRFFPNRFILG